MCKRVQKRTAHLEKVDVWMAKENREELEKSSGTNKIMHSESEQNELDVEIK